MPTSLQTTRNITIAITTLSSRTHPSLASSYIPSILLHRLILALCVTSRKRHDESPCPKQPGFFPPTNEPAVSIYENFVAALEGFLGVRRTEYDFYEGRFSVDLADG